MIEAVFFDVGNTLLKPHPSVTHVVREVLAEAGYVRDSQAIDALMPMVDAYYEDRYREDDTFWTDEERTSQVWVGMYSLLCRKLEIVADAESLAMRVYEEFGDAGRWVAYDDVMPALERLRQAGIKIGLISNWDRRLSTIVAGLGLDVHIDTIVSSADVGLHKPDPRIFEMAAQRLGVSPIRAVHVGDHLYADVVGANAAGMTPVLIDRHEGAHPGYERFIRSLDSLEVVLGMGEAVRA